jgi:hypothetical protein
MICLNISEIKRIVIYKELELTALIKCQEYPLKPIKRQNINTVDLFSNRSKILLIAVLITKIDFGNSVFNNFSGTNIMIAKDVVVQ